MPFDIKTAIEIEEKEREIERKIKESNAIDSMVKELIDKAPETAKIQLLNTILENIMKNPELLRKFRTELKI